MIAALARVIGVGGLVLLLALAAINSNRTQAEMAGAAAIGAALAWGFTRIPEGDRP